MELMKNQGDVSEKEYVRSQLEGFRFKINADLEQAERMHVQSEFEATGALEIIGKARSLNKDIESVRKKAGEPYRKMVNYINDLAKGFTEKLDRIEWLLKSKIAIWEREQEKARQEAEAEAEEMAALMEHPVVAYVPEVPQVMRAEGVTSYKQSTWTFEVEAVDLVPREYLMIDHGKLKAAVKSGLRSLPGVRIFEETKTVIRSR